MSASGTSPSSDPAGLLRFSFPLIGDKKPGCVHGSNIDVT
jgi:hypothetical protein